MDLFLLIEKRTGRIHAKYTDMMTAVRVWQALTSSGHNIILQQASVTVEMLASLSGSPLSPV